MKTLLVFPGILWLALCPIARQTNARQDVEHAFNRFIAAFNNLDWDQFRSTFADEVTVFNPDIPETPSVVRLDGRRQVEEGRLSTFMLRT